MRLFAETHHTDADFTEPPESYNEIVDVIGVQDEDEDFFGETGEEMTEDEVLALAAELLTEEEAEELAAELEAEFWEPVPFEFQQPPQIEEEHDDEVCEVDQEEMEREKQRAEELEMFRLSRAELQKRLAEIDEELESLRIRKEKRRKEQAEYLELIVQYEQARKEREEKERMKRQEEIEKKRQERERRKQAMTNPLAYQHHCIQIKEERPANLKFVNRTPEEHARQKEETLSRLVPPLDLNAASEEVVREVAADLHAKLRNVFGVIFDLNEKMKETSDFDVSLRGPTQPPENPATIPGGGGTSTESLSVVEDGFVEGNDLQCNVSIGVMPGSDAHSAM